jgi:hypothetical protein
MGFFSKKNFLTLFLIIHLLISLFTLTRLDFYFSYLIFCLFFFYIIYLTIKRSDSYSIIYLFIFLYLGFWLKFSYFVIFNDYKLTYFIEQNRIGPHPNVLNYSKVLIISSLSVFIIFINYLFYSFLFKKISFSFIKLKKFNYYFLKNKLFIRFFFSIIFCIYILNFFFGIYYKGKLNSNIFSKISNIMMTIMPYVVLCLIIDYFTNVKKKIIYLFLSLFTGFLESISILSRAMIFAQFSIFIPSILKIVYRIKIKRIFYFLTSILLIFLISVFIVNNLRSKKNNVFFQINENAKAVEKNNIKEASELTKFFKNIKELEKLFFYRWVGIDGLINVLDNNERKFAYYFETNDNFYISEFMSGYDIGSTKAYIETIITPGFIAYSHYGGNLFLSFIILSLITFAIFFIEKFTLVLTSSNTLSSFLSYFIVWRIIHMGHSNVNTLILFFFLALIPLSLFFLNYILKQKFYDK